MATKFLRKIILEELQKVLKEGLGSDPEFAGQGNLTEPSGMPRKSAADRLPQQSFDYYAGKIKNSDVGQLQQYLIDLGYKVMPSIPGKPQMPDGYIGWRTLGAARKVFNDPSLTEKDLMTAIKSYNKVAAYKVANKSRKTVSAIPEKESEEMFSQYPESLKNAMAGKASAPPESAFPSSSESKSSSTIGSSTNRPAREGDEKKTDTGIMVYRNGEWVDKMDEAIAREIRKLLKNF